MLEVAPRNLEVGFIVIAAIGAGVIVYSVVAKRNIFVFAADALLAAAALVAPMLLRPPPISVVIVKQEDGNIAVQRKDGFYGGTYTTRAGRRISVDPERRWGRTATLVINDSARLLKITAHRYSRIKHAPGGPTLMAFVLPMRMKVLPRRIDHTGSERQGPPEEIESPSSVDVRIFLAYSDRPYDPKTHGGEEKLRQTLGAPDRYEAVSLTAP